MNASPVPAQGGLIRVHTNPEIRYGFHSHAGGDPIGSPMLLPEGWKFARKLAWQ